MMQLTSYRHIFFLGIGGIGMSALARFCMRWGIHVSGYDRQSSGITEALIHDGARVLFEDDPALLQHPPDLVIYTPAIPVTSRLRLYFETSGVPMVKRSEALEVLTRGVDTMAIAGTHGKTTTSSMISFLMQQCDIAHTALLGGIAANYGSNFYSDGLEMIVAEADEYDRSFWRLFPRWAVVTAMDPDHLDIYGTYAQMLEGYRQFIRQIQPGGVLLYRHDLLPLLGDALMGELKEKNINVKSYGLAEGDYHTQGLQVDRGVWRWDLVTPDGIVRDLALMMPGRHNVENATGASAMILEAGGAEEKLQKAMPGYKGVSRRFEIRYRDDQRVLIDDYAHHPAELVAAITAARETYGGPVTGVFQPHLYSRTRDLADEFAAALDLLDVPVIIDIYPARELPIEGVSSQTIYDRMQNKNKRWCRGDSWVEWIASHKPGVLIILGAGDLDQHIPDLIRRLYTNENNN